MKSLLCGLALIALCSCSKSKISGEIFLSPSVGVSLPVGGIEVAVISREEVETFLSKKKSEIGSVRSQLKNATTAAELKLKDANQKDEEAKLQMKMGVEGFLTNDNYLKVSDQLKQSQQNYSKAKAQYAQFQSNLRSSGYQPGQPYRNISDRNKAQSITGNSVALENAMEQWREACDLLNAQMSALTASNQSYYAHEEWPYSLNVGAAKTELENAQKIEAAYPSLENIFSDFQPHKLDSTFTGSDGGFSLSAKAGNFLFSKTKVEEIMIYWLVEVKGDGRKEILSNFNLFNSNRIFPLQSQ